MITINATGDTTIHTAGKYCAEDILVKVPEGSADPVLQEKTVEPDRTQQVVTADDGYDALSSVTVKPIGDEYVIPEGTLEVTENGTHDVSEYDSVNVSVPIPDGYIQPSGTKTIDENGTYDITEYANVTVAVPDESPVLQEKTVTENGEVTPDDGYDGLSKVTINVPIPDGYIQPSGILDVIENGIHDVTAYTSVNVNVPSSGGSGDEGTNAQWFADLITDSERAIEVYNDKFKGTLSAYAFYERSNVTKIELPNLQYLKERCFFGCQNLKTLLLPGLIGYTYQYMASGCTALVNVDIHGTSYISSYTFQSCTSLKKVDLHRVGTIATNAFNGATKFETLIIRTDTVPTLGGTNAFTNTKIKSGGTGYIYVPAALVDTYKAASNWSTFVDQFRAIEDYPDICGG